MKTLLVSLVLLVPITAFANENVVYDTCMNSIPDITRDYHVKNLDLLDDGYSVLNVNGEAIVTCKYLAISTGNYRGVDGDGVIVVDAKLNISSKKFNVEIY